MHSILVRSMLLRSLSVVIVGAVIAGLFALAGCVRAPARIVEIVEVTGEVVVTAPPIATATAPVPPPRAASSITPVPGLAEKLRAAVVPATVSPAPPTATATALVPPPRAVSSITPVPGLAEKLRAAVVPATALPAPPTATATVTPVPPPRAASSITPVPGLAEKLRAAVVATTPYPTSTPCDATGATMDDEMLDQMATWMLEKVNEVREQNGLGSLVLDDNTSAQSHASAMLRDRYAPLLWGSETYWPGKPHVNLYGQDPYDRWVEHDTWAEHRGSRWVRVLENIWWVTGSAKMCEGHLRAWVSTAMRDWMGSDGHRRNLLDPSVDAVSLGFSWGVRRGVYIDPRFFAGDDYWDVYMVQVFIGPLVE